MRALCDHTVRNGRTHLSTVLPVPTANETDSGDWLREALRASLPIPVDARGLPDPAAIEAIRRAMQEAAARQDYRLATGFSDLLAVAEPRPEPLTLEDCVGGQTPEEKARFFARHGLILVPRVFTGEHLARLQRVWRVASASARAQWEAAKLHGKPPSPMDGIYFENQAELNQQFPDLGAAGFGRKWFDIPRPDFYAEAIQAHGDGVILDLIDPPELLDVLAAVTGGPDVRCIGIQPRVVPPEDEGGYTAWHRDMKDNQSVAVEMPQDGRIVKAIIYLEDCPAKGGANAVVACSHRLPFGPGEVYGKQFYDGNEDTRNKALPLDSIPNHVAFTCPAGWCAIFDIAAWHTALHNAGPGDRQNMIMSYMQQPRFSTAGSGNHAGISHEFLEQMDQLGRMPQRRRRVLGLPEEGEIV